MSHCGARDPAREGLKSDRKQAQISAIAAVIRRPFAIFAAALREIFEESAYDRFLARAQEKSSPAAYAKFLQETEAARARRPKCC